MRDLFDFQEADNVDFSNYGGNRINIDETEKDNYMDDVLNVNYLLSHTESNSSSKRKNSLKPLKKDVSIKAKIIRDGKAINVKGGLDFDEGMGKRCIEKKEEIETIERNPILECKHR